LEKIEKLVTIQVMHQECKKEDKEIRKYRVMEVTITDLVSGILVSGIFICLNR